jgi:lipid II:glycine glycyltransferase (peptidoglycan interpeptide bridge formation enzyme)
MENASAPLGLVQEAPVPAPAGPAAVPSAARASAQEDRWAAWDRFCEVTPTTGFMQSSWWADFRLTLGYGHFGEIFKDGGAIVGGAIVQKYVHSSGSAFYYIQDGPVLPENPALAVEVLTAMLQAIDERRRSDAETVSHLRIEPRWERASLPRLDFEPVVRPDRYVEPRQTLCIDLRPTTDAILAKMKPKGRYNVSVARRHGVTVVEDTSPTGLADFVDLYHDTAARRRFRPKPPSYFETLMGLTVPGRRGSIYFAEHEGRRLSAAFVVRFGSRATYFYGGSSAERRHVMASYLLHFEIICREKQAGHDCYDLWGVAPEGEGASSWAGFSAFKRRLGGCEVRLAPTLDYVYDRPAYATYAAWEAVRRNFTVLA